MRPVKNFSKMQKISAMTTTPHQRFGKRILVACEESDEVRGRFARLGFDAYSCDLQPSRNPNAKHFQCDLTEVLRIEWDVIIAFPPCTHLAVSGAAHFGKKRIDGRQKQAVDFFMQIVNAPAKYIAIENPVGIMSSVYKKPDQIIQPYFFGDAVKKTTCLWLKGLPKLMHSDSSTLFDSKTHVAPVLIPFKSKKTKSGFSMYSGNAARRFSNDAERSKERSKTFPGIADAMATQWGDFLNQTKLF